LISALRFGRAHRFKPLEQKIVSNASFPIVGVKLFDLSFVNFGAAGTLSEN